MKRVVRFLASLYPAAWRRRYAAEFDALLEDDPASWRNLINVLLGAFKMQLTNWNFVKIVMATAVFGALAGAAGSFAIPKVYRSTAVIRMNAPFDATKLPARGVLTHMPDRIQVKPIQAQAFTIQLDDRDPQIATHTLQEVTAALLAENVGQRRYLGSSLLLEVVDPAIVPTGPISPNRLAIAGWGLVAGIGTGVLLIAFRRSAGEFPRPRSTPDET